MSSGGVRCSYSLPFYILIIYIMLELTVLYIIIFSCLLSTIYLYYIIKIGYFTLIFYRVKWYFDFLSIERRSWNEIRITAFHISIFLLYTSANIAFLLWKDKTDISTRAAIAAITNLVPIMLGGRTNILADYIGVSLQSYYLVHHWLARLVIGEVIIHAGFARKDKWTLQAIFGLVVRIPILTLSSSNLKYLGIYSPSYYYHFIYLFYTENPPFSILYISLYLSSHYAYYTTYTCVASESGTETARRKDPTLPLS